MVDARLGRADARKLLCASATLAMNQLLQFLIPLVTLLALGRAGVLALAAGSLVGSVNLLLHLSALGLLQGLVPVLAAARGSGSAEAMAGAARAALFVTVAVGGVVIAAMAALAPALSLLGHDPAVIAQARMFAGALLPGLPASVLFLGLRFALIALDQLRGLNRIVLAAAACNLIANLLLGACMGLGVRSVALSVSLANCLMLTLALLSLIRRPELVRLLGAQSPASWRGPARTILAIGIPLGAVMFTETLLLTGSGVLMAYFGADALAAHGLVLNWLHLALMIPVAISYASMSHVAYLVSCGETGRARTAAIAAMSMAAGYVLLLAVVFVSFPEALVRALLWSRQDSGEELVVVAARLLRLCAITQACSAMVVVCASLLRALGDRAAVLWLVALIYWGVGLGGAALLAFAAGMGANGIWVAMSLGFASSLAVVCFRLARLAGRIDRGPQCATDPSC